MGAQQIGTLKSGRTNKPYKVLWDSKSQNVYVGTYGNFFISGGNVNIGKANTVTDAMRKAEAYLYSR